MNMNIKKLGLSLLATALLFGCGNKKEEPEAAASAEPTPEPTPTPTPRLIPEGTYFSELTGEPIDETIKDQRPVAVMVDNEILAYPHFGVAEADVVYEMVNSMENERITRLMALVKDWSTIEQMGSIRSTRHTNIYLQAEWNSILCHDGQANNATPLFEKSYARDHISGTFSRIPNGKSYEFTEYITPGDIEGNVERMNISPTYTADKPDVESHFQFVEYKTENMTDDKNQVAKQIKLPFPHNETELRYNEETKTYDYYNYGMLHVDGEDNEVLTFKNLIIQNVAFEEIDDQYHVVYNLVDSGKEGYYISNGHAQPITWEKKSETDITRYYDMNGNELQINRGKTYIGLVLDDSWSEVQIIDPDAPQEESTEEENTAA